MSRMPSTAPKTAPKNVMKMVVGWQPQQPNTSHKGYYGC